ncbi:MAG TPA: FAD-dependent oxidoreductase [Lachnospiraceae bacterium]|nr:FAD-dependent oxidoreductase [Lachnospiraceae bacterium]
METRQYDAIIIGFGKGGKTLAGKLGSMGKSVALIEKDPGMYGGTCINVGCIPSKSLYTSAGRANGAAELSRKAAYFKAAIEEKRRLTAMLRGKNYDKVNNIKTVDVIDGEAHFTGPKAVEVVTSDGSLQLTGGQIFINTGSESRIPPIEGITETKGVYTSNGILDLNEFPGKLLILGGGYIGLEFASMYASFGSKVTILQDSGIFLPREDRDVADKIQELLEAQGVEILFNRKTVKFEDGQSGPVVTVQNTGAGNTENAGKDVQNGNATAGTEVGKATAGTEAGTTDPADRKTEAAEIFEADAVLVATGRAPNIRKLNLEAAGVEVTPRGAVKVDEYLKTTAPDIYAMGDVTGGLQHTYVSLDDFRVVISQLTGGKSSGGKIYTTKDRKNVPYSVFLRTPYARIGMNETEAGAAGRKVKIAKLPTAAVPKAQVLKAPQGFMKAVIDADTGKILGVMLLCQEAYEMINTVKTAMDLDADYTVLRDQIYTHPTMTEAFNDLFAI